MIIDAFTHIYPQPYFNLVAGVFSGDTPFVSAQAKILSQNTQKL